MVDSLRRCTVHVVAGSRWANLLPFFVVARPILSAFRQLFNNLRLTGRSGAWLLLPSVLSENRPRGYRFSRGRSRTIHLRQTTCLSRFGVPRTHTATWHSSHHQVLPLGDI